MPGQTVPSNLSYEVEIEGFPQTGLVQYSGAPGSPTTFVLTFTVAEDAAVGSYSATVVCRDGLRGYLLRIYGELLDFR